MENVLLGLIIAGFALCGAYFWAEIARRRHDDARTEKRRRAQLIAPSQASSAAPPPAHLIEAANDGVLPAARRAVPALRR